MRLECIPSAPEESAPSTEMAAAILLVEDDRDLREYMSHALSRHYAILTACDGTEAFKVLEKSSADVIVSDVMMPNMDGVELCRRLKMKSTSAIFR